MSETKFTPGPWKVVHGGDPRDFIVTESTGNTCGRSRADLWDGMNVGEDVTCKFCLKKMAVNK